MARLALLLLVVSVAAEAQPAPSAPSGVVLPATLEGVVVDRAGKPIPRAAISGETTKTESDAEGRFSLSIIPPADGEAAVITVIKQGFDPVVFEEQVKPGETRQVRYQMGKAALSAVITGTRQLPRLPSVEREPIVSHFDVTRSELSHTPGAMEDINRAIANLPGVVADPDLLATLFIRGGAPEELGVYLDDVPLDNPLHLGGFASVFNPMLIESADLWAGVTPARYEPSLSGAMEVHYPTVTADRLHFQADLSIQTAKVRVDAPTGVEGLTVVLAARRSFFEAYFAALHAFGVIGGNYVAPELSEYFARVIYKRGRHLFTATYLLALDGFTLVDDPNSPALFGFDGGVSLSHVLHVTSLRDRIDLGDLRELTVTLAATHDSDSTSVTGSTPFARDESRLDFVGSANLTLPFNPANRLRLGAQIRRQRYDLHGDVADERGLAPWIALPIIDTGEPDVAISPRILRTLVAGYAEYSWRPWTPLAFELGGRLEDAAGTAVYSTRFATAFELPVKTVLKAEAGIATQLAADPLLLDAAYGNPRLLPERSRQLVVGLEQPLPFRALLRIEGYSKWLDRLVVNP
ncbi:MAG TPA: TonB-dependent receptor, partial [Myxococcales bacterium]|nr:TonB-dependent receptor [Myxococcales bacterium]